MSMKKSLFYCVCILALVFGVGVAGCAGKKLENITELHGVLVADPGIKPLIFNEDNQKILIVSREGRFQSYDLGSKKSNLLPVTLPSGQYIHWMFKLPEGEYLILGVEEKDTSEKKRPFTEIYNRKTNKISRISGMKTPRFFYSAVQMQDGDILVTGGATEFMSSGKCLGSAEIFETKNKIFNSFSMEIHPRCSHYSVQLDNEEIALVGGSSELVNEFSWDEYSQKSIEIWNVAKKEKIKDIYVDDSGNPAYVDVLQGNKIFILPTYKGAVYWGNWNKAVIVNSVNGKSAFSENSLNCTPNKFIYPENIDNRFLVFAGAFSDCKNKDIHNRIEYFDVLENEFKAMGKSNDNLSNFLSGMYIQNNLYFVNYNKILVIKQPLKLL